jgi:hypothetical protein
MPVPVMTPEQRADALVKAAAARRERAEALGKVRDGTVSIPAVLASTDSPLLAAPVYRVLRAVPGIGDAKAEQMLAAIGVEESVRKTRRVRGLGPRQRSLLAELFAA